MGPTIDINMASTKELTQFPGIAKNVAYRIVRHRARHGYFTHWEELGEVKDFPSEALEEIKLRATLKMPPDVKENPGPRRIKPAHLEREAKKPKGYNKKRREARKSSFAFKH